MSEPAIELTTSSTQDRTSTELDRPAGEIVIDKHARAVSVDGRPVTLTPLEFSLLAYFIDHAGHPLTRSELLRDVWGEYYNGGPRTLDIHVSRLRRKLGPDLQLDTLRRLGYRFGSRRQHETRGALEAVK